MNMMPNDKSWQGEGVSPSGTYWTPPVAISVDELDPLLQNTMEVRLDTAGAAEAYDIYVAGAFDMASCAPAGHFTIAINKNNHRATGMFSGDSLAKPTRLAFDGNIDNAFSALYKVARDQGHLF